MISKETKKHIWYLYDIKKMSKSKIAQKVGVSRNSVIKILEDKSTVSEQFLKDAQNIERKSNESLLKMIQDDDRLPSIVSKILDIMNDDEQLTNEIKRNGLRPLATVLGILSDKSIRLAEMHKGVNSPNNVKVTIVNDADTVAKFEEEVNESKYTN